MSREGIRNRMVNPLNDAKKQRFWNMDKHNYELRFQDYCREHDLTDLTR